MIEMTIDSHCSDLAASWFEALMALEVRHPNGTSVPILRISDGAPPSLYVGLDETRCTLTGEVKRDFAISNIALTYFPGERLARMWFAAAWSGYLQHEALELVTHQDRAVLDPHEEPYATCPANRCLRDAFPVTLTPTTLEATLALVLPRDEVVRLVAS